MTTATQDPTEGWKNYPKNLKLRDSTVSEINYDCNFYHEKLTSDSSRLFGKKAEIKIKVIEFGSTDYNIEDLVGLQDYIQQRRNKKNTRIFLIPQRSSWGPLVINYEALCKFFSYIEVFPAFIDVLQCFGQKEGYEGETYSHYACQETQSHIRRSILVTVQNHETLCLFIKQLILQIPIEISYLIKHVELHGRKEERNPWSVRQMGVYYRDDNKHGNTFVVLNPSRAFQRRLEVVRQTLPIPSAHDIHTLILSSATSSWRSCITDMEKNYESMSVKAQQSNIVGPGEKWGFLTDVCYNDSQDIQVLQDDCFKLGHVLEMTLTILQHIQLSWANLDPASVGSIQVQSNPIQTILIDIEMQLRRAKTILKRLGGTLQLVN
ncbi:hypothetical protein MMC17_008003 [Xylographa soralifera]|nr:hypothetical protein [Xylographa soralifera]